MHTYLNILIIILGKQCWYKCGSKGGKCDHFCGRDGVCCRKNWSGDNKGCENAASPCKGMHCCTKGNIESNTF